MNLLNGEKVPRTAALAEAEAAYREAANRVRGALPARDLLALVHAVDVERVRALAAHRFSATFPGDQREVDAYDTVLVALEHPAVFARD